MRELEYNLSGFGKRISLKLKISVLLLICIGLASVVRGQEIPAFSPKPDAVPGTYTPIINLNGEWQFSSSPSSRFWRSPSAGMQEWNTIMVPGEWVMQGFEVEPNTMAAYYREVDIPASWKDNLVFLKCDGVYSIAKVYINGKLAGSHEGGFTPFQIDLTGFIKPGNSNSIIIGVQSESLADTLASASQYAAHQLGGITRKLEIFSLPKTYIKSLNYTTEISEGKDARIIADLVIANAGNREASGLELRLNIRQPDGPSILVPGNNKLPAIPAGAEQKYTISVPVRNALQWDPEHPHLYMANVRLLQNGEVLHSSSDKIGIRKIEIVGNQVFLNGSPIKLRGVNRHEVHPTRGRSLTMNEWLTDATLFKEANVNYIRTSHYPPAEEFISICDSLGLLVECEAPLCWIGHGASRHWLNNDPHDPALYPLIRQMVLETVAQYRNHPSVIIWSLANESAWGPNWEKALKDVMLADPSRPASFHDQAYGGFNNFGSKDVPVANIHYPGPGGPEIARKFERPLLFGEYAHLNTYNRQEIVTDPGVRDAWGRGLESMWENMYHSTGCLGGAIWSGIDDVFYLPSGKAVGYGEWGPIDGWRRTKPEYWHLKKIYSPVKIIQEKVRLPDPESTVMKIAIQNRHLFTDLSELDINWKLAGKSGKVRTNLPPGKSGIMEIPMPDEAAAGDTLELAFYSHQSFLIDIYNLIVVQDTRSEKNKLNRDKASQERIEIVDKPEMIVYENRISVTMGDEVWSINAVNGKIENVRKRNKTIIEEGPELMMLPLRTGPCNTEHSLNIEALNDVCSNWKGRISGTGEKGDAVYVEVEGSYDEADIVMVYWFGRSSWVEIEYKLTVKKKIDPRQIGLVFTLPRDFDNFSWERKGQWNYYPESHIGRTTGSARPFPNGTLVSGNHASRPSVAWEQDYHPMGINDFRATRDKLVWGKLEDGEACGIKIVSDGSGAMRPYLSKDKIKFLAAGFSTAGGDLFFSSHLREERNPLEKGDVFKSILKLDIE